jgi:serine/threonine protein kinase
MKNCPTCHSTYPSDFALCPRDGAALVESGAWREGTLVRGKYRILAVLGGGGMATVYKALHERFGEVRALKVILPERANDPNFVKRFTHEAVLTRKLQHPNAVRVEDIDEAEDGRPFMVMEYIEGRSLKDVIQQESPMAVERVCAIIKQVASALDAAHRLGIVHRDIKPANVVLLEGGAGTMAVSGDDVTQEFSTTSVHRAMAQSPVPSTAHSPDQPVAKVLDFGIAKVKEGHFEDPGLRQMTLTGAGMVVGTPAYMSPEQAVGKRGSELDGRSDLYSLAVVMYQMLTGELPLKADSEMALMIAHIQTAPADVRIRRPDLPEPLARLVMRCLEKNPDERPASGKALIAEIESWEQESARRQAARRRAEEERLKAEVERKAREEAEARQRAEVERRAAEEARRAEAQRRAQEEAEARERAALERRAREAEEARARERAAAERRSREAEQWRKAEAERKAREEEAQRRTEAELKAREPRAAERQGRTSGTEGEIVGPGRRRRAKVAAIGLAAVGLAGVALSAYVIRRPKPGTVRPQNPEVTTPPIDKPAPPPETQPAPVQTPTNPPPTELEETAAANRPAKQIADLTRQGDADYKNAQYDAAIKRYQQASALDPANKELTQKIQQAHNKKQVAALITRGDSYYETGDYDSAIAQYQKALALDPDNTVLSVKIKKTQRAKNTERSLSVP